MLPECNDRQRLLVKQEEISSRSGKYTEVDRLEIAAHEYERAALYQHSKITVSTVPACTVRVGKQAEKS